MSRRGNKDAAGADTSIRGDAKGSDKAASAATWRHLPFYETHLVRDVDDFAKSPAVFDNPADVSATAHLGFCPAFAKEAFEDVLAQQAAAQASLVTRNESIQNSRREAVNSRSGTIVGAQRRAFLLVGSNRGTVHLCDAEDYRLLGHFSAFYSAPQEQADAAGSSKSNGLSAARVTHIVLDGRGRLYTVGEDDGVPFPILRIWDLRSVVTDKTGRSMPRLLGESRVQHGSKPHPVSAMTVTPSSSFLAIGLADGTVLLLRGLKEALTALPKWQPGTNVRTPATTLPKFKVAHQYTSSKEISPVTALGFSEQSAEPSQASFKSERLNVRKEPQPRVPKQRKALAEAKEADATDEADRQTSSIVYLFIVSITKVLRYTVIGKGAGAPASIIDDVGCALNCAAMLPASSLTAQDDDPVKNSKDRLVLARDEAIYVIGQEGREMTLALEGKRAAIRLVQSQLVIISPPLAPADAGTGHDSMIGRHRKAVSRPAMTGKQTGRENPADVAMVTVFDLDDKLIAYSAVFDGGVRDAWHDGLGDICVLSDDGTLTRFDEKTLRQKLDLLFDKSLYLLAIGVARSHVARSRTSRLVPEHASVPTLLADIHCKYGENLYEKGDYEGAIAQFVQTIGVTQPSYVIRKFLDAQRIRNLTTYLQELHTRGFANSDHTTLLLNCYAKLKDVAALDRFIHRPLDRNDPEKQEREEDLSEDDGEGVEDLPFDLNTAINVCRQGGYFEHAAYLAKRHGRPDEYLRIIIEDRADYDEAMKYISALSAQDAQRNLTRYGLALLSHDKKATTDLLIELCSGAFEPTPIAIGAGIDAAKIESKSAAAYLSYLQVGKLGKQTTAAQRPRSGHVGAAQLTKKGNEAAADDSVVQRSMPPSVEVFFSLFLKYKDEFVRLLESVALARWGQRVELDNSSPSGYEKSIPEPTYISGEEEIDAKSDEQSEQELLWNTLLELYITMDTAPVAESQSRQKALALLRQHNTLPYDIASALVCCVNENFEEGALHLYERLGMYEEIVRQCIDAEERADEAGHASEADKAGSMVMQALSRFGPRMPDLYAIVLQHLIATETLLKRHNADIEGILAQIFDESLLSPLEVVQMLSQSPVAPVSLLRSHLLRVLQGQQADIATNASLTQTYRRETREKQADIAALKDEDQTRIFQQTRCSVCHGQLDLPSVHFMCRHSFHSRCLGAGENECPVCAKSHATILEIRRNNTAFGQRHDLFISEVEEAEDGFDVVANMFSKGLFDPQVLQTQSSES